MVYVFLIFSQKSRKKLEIRPKSQELQPGKKEFAQTCCSRAPTSHSFSKVWKCQQRNQKFGTCAHLRTPTKKKLECETGALRLVIQQGSSNKTPTPRPFVCIVSENQRMSGPRTWANSRRRHWSTDAAASSRCSLWRCDRAGTPAPPSLRPAMAAEALGDCSAFWAPDPWQEFWPSGGGQPGFYQDWLCAK